MIYAIIWSISNLISSKNKINAFLGDEVADDLFRLGRIFLYSFSSSSVISIGCCKICC